VGRVIAIVNQKGGVGKTTTTVNLGTALADAGHRVLLVDLDPQAHTTFGVGVDPAACEASVFHVLVEGLPVDAVVRPTAIQGLDVLPSHIGLAAAEAHLLNAMAREQLLRVALDPVRTTYDYTLLDCPPTLGLLTINALAAADEVIVPVQAQGYAMLGFNDLARTIEMARQRINPRLTLRGILVTQFDGRTSAQRAVLGHIVAEYGARYPLFRTTIKQATCVHEAALEQLPVLRYDPKSASAAAYRQLAAEVVAGGSPAGPAGDPVGAGARPPAPKAPATVREGARG
jgi:chromosome partitioning protein